MRILHVNDVASVGTLLVAASRGRDTLYQPVVRHDFLRGTLRPPVFAWGRIRDVVRLRGLVRPGGFTHVHVHYALFAHLAELAGARYSLHLHGGDLLLDLRPEVGGGRGGRVKRWLTRRGIAGATHVAVATPDLLAYARRLRPDAVYIPNPIEIPPAPSIPPRRDRPHLVVLSKMDRLKGWSEQPLVLEAIHAALPRMTFSFFAHGQLDEAERRRLRERLVALGGEVMPPLSRAEFHARIAAADFALGQLDQGSLGMSELEATALGVPTVANARAHEAAGYAPVVIRPADAPAALRRLWDEGPAARAAWGERARGYLRAVHAPEQSLAALERLLAASPD